jgi:hypothetical protein
MARQDERVRLSCERSLSAMTAIALTTLAAACGSGSDQPAGETFPISVLRKGGVAGLDQRVVVDESGRASATGRGAGAPCTLDRPALQDLSALASHVKGTAATTYANPDDLVVVVQTPRGSTRLGDLEAVDGNAVVTHLFHDLFGTTGERAVCR